MSDSNEQETRQEEAVQETVLQPEVELPGRRLREQRESRHLSLDEVAHHLRLDVQLISSLEMDDYSDMPSAAYICGYLRSYARLLKLPEDEVVQAYTHGKQINETLIPSNVSIKLKKAPKLGWIKPVVIIAVIILVAGGLYMLSEKYNFFNPEPVKKSSEITVPVPPAERKDKSGSGNDTSTSTTVESAPSAKAVLEKQQDNKTPAQTEVGKTVVENLPTPKTKIPENESIAISAQQPAAAPVTNKAQNTGATTPANTKQLQLHFNDDSWAEVTDSTGKKLVYRLVRKGTELTLDGVPPFALVLGNAPEVQVFYDGKEFDHSRYHRGEVAYFKIGKK